MPRKLYGQSRFHRMTPKAYGTTSRRARRVDKLYNFVQRRRAKAKRTDFLGLW